MSVTRVVGLGVVALALSIFLLIGGAFGCKEYSRYQGREDAKNDLIRAESTRKIKVEEAKAAKLSAVELAEAEILRARGVAKANEIIAGSITPEYLRYFYIQQLSEVEHLGGKIIYVPTEAGLPILEANRLEGDQP
jgi:regulator of protease activity HflC (stomatin/prohibitin superfamily)